LPFLVSSAPIGGYAILPPSNLQDLYNIPLWRKSASGGLENGGICPRSRTKMGDIGSTTPERVVKISKARTSVRGFNGQVLLDDLRQFRIAFPRETGRT
jgi:hypothetical protein